MILRNASKVFILFLTLTIQVLFISTRASENKLSFNESKAKFVLFKNQNKSKNTQISLRINVVLVKQVSSVRFVSLIIDKKLKWKERIDSI